MTHIRETSSKLCQIPAPKLAWHPNKGEWAKITSGPFEGRQVRCEKVIGKKAKRFLMDLGGGREAIVRIEQLEAV